MAKKCYSPPSQQKKLERFQTWPLQSLVPSIVRASPNIFCAVPSFNVYIPQQLQLVANDSGHLPRAKSPWVDSKSKDMFVFKLFEAVVESGKASGSYVQY
jgi:hypothetical protein